jgi:tRNA dimethylallyltransferase
LLAELQNRDPEAWARIDRFNRRRVERAVEVLRLTGRRESERRRWDPGGGSGSDLVVVVLRRDPADLRRRIEARVDAMFARGLVEETRGLLARGLRANRVACQALGYRQAIEHLDGARSLAETVELVKRKTWQFARRQATWFRHQLPVTWLDVAEHETPAAMAARIPRPPGMTLTGSAAGEPPQSG